ncbi:sigma-70 family RNA polymerase sigma factor [Celeribacter arenosi]
MLAVRDHRDKAAFACLFDHFGPRLRGMLMRSGVSAAQAEDIVQDVMLSVWRKAASFNPERADVAGWVFQIARNRKIDIIRRERRPVPEDLSEPTVDEADGEQIVALEQEAAKLRRALSALSPEQRSVVERAYMGDLTHAEIQAETGLPLGTIKSRIRLGIERLRHELKGDR